MENSGCAVAEYCMVPANEEDWTAVIHRLSTFIIDKAAHLSVELYVFGRRRD